jgi:hypothetical protein
MTLNLGIQLTPYTFKKIVSGARFKPMYPKSSTATTITLKN